MTMDSPAEPSAPTTWRRVLHPFVIMPVVVLVAVGVWWVLFHSSTSSASSTNPGTAAQVVSVTNGPMDQTVSAQGTIAAVSTDQLSFSSGGFVTSVNVRAGDTVTAGEVLATLDSASLQANVSQAQASVAQAQAKYSDDRAAGASSAQLNADATSVTTATDSLTSTQAALSAATLTASFDGVVASVNIVAGQQLGSSGTGATTPSGSGSGSGASSSNVGTGSSSNTQNRASTTSSSSAASTSTGQIVVTTTGVYQVTLPIGSSDITRIVVGQNVNLAVTTSTAVGGGGNRAAQATTTTTQATANRPTVAGSTATGKVASVGAVASASSGVASFPVVVEFQGDPTKFFVGASVIANVVTNTTGDVLSVPFRAVIVAADGTSTVELSTDGSATHTKNVTVTTGTTANGQIEVKSGLKAGDQVVVAARGGIAGGNVPGQGNNSTNGGTGRRTGAQTGGQTQGTGQ